MKKYLLIFILSGMLFSVYSQDPGFIVKTFNSIFNDTTSVERPKFLAYPTIAYSPETKWEIGVGAIYVFYANRDTSNRLSEITAFTFLTLEQQYGLWMDHAFYSDKSKWFFLGKARFQQFPLLYFGIGPEVTGEELAEIGAGSIALRERFLRKVKGSFYAGVEVDFQNLSNVALDPISEQPFEEPIGLEDYTNLGIGLGLVYDDRHNVLNVRKGFFGETGFLRYDDSWGSDYSFTSYFLDGRYFIPTTKNQVLASQLFFSHVDGTAPFNQLSLMGGENIMRGYYLGRYRDNTLIALQSEYRFLPFSFSKRWGAAAFFSAGTVSESPSKIDLSYLKVAGGAGVRFLIFPSKDVYTRFDVAFTEDGPGYYIFIGEAF